MGAQFGGDDDVLADINITPFVDIVLVVLIIFMVTAVDIVQQSIQVELPEASTASASESVSVGITLTRDGGLLLDGEPTSTEALRAHLATVKSESEEVVCLVAADRQVPHGRVVWLMDLLRTEGLYKYAFNIDPTRALPPDPSGEPAE